MPGTRTTTATPPPPSDAPPEDNRQLLSREAHTIPLHHKSKHFAASGPQAALSARRSLSFFFIALLSSLSCLLVAYSGHPARAQSQRSRGAAATVSATPTP